MRFFLSPFLFFILCSHVHAATIISGKDKQAKLPYWQVTDQGMSLRLVQRPPDMFRGFFLGRGFDVKLTEVLVRAWKKIKDKGVVILAVNVGEGEDKIFDFTGDYPMSFPVLMDIKGAVIKEYPAIGLPTTYVVSPKGLVTHRAVGSREWDDPALLKKILALRSPG